MAAAARARPGSGGGGRGMVVLSRPRSSQKTGPKLSVPPPLNLPSLRKEHERFDPSGSGGLPGGAGGRGAGARPTSSGMGWTKPAAVVSQEKDGPGVEESVDVVTKGNGASRLSLARSSGTSGPLPGTARDYPSPMEKASVLRGEDFPSLRAALPVSTGSTQKQKEGISQKQKQMVTEQSSYEQRDVYGTRALVDVSPQEQPFHHTVGNVLVKKGGEDHRLGNSRTDDRARKQEDYFPGLLPLVRLNPRSDWADDERDTGHGFSDRGGGIGFAKDESYWDRDLDMPRASGFPHKPVYNQYERLGKRDNETGEVSSSEVLKVEPYHRDVRMPSREGRQDNNWRTAHFLKDQEFANGRNSVTARTSGFNRDTWKENKYIAPRAGGPARDGDITVNRDSTFGRRDMIHAPEVRQNWKDMAVSISKQVVERNARDRYITEHGNRYRGDGLQNSAVSKSSFISGGKASCISDSVVSIGPEKRGLSKSEMFYDDPFCKGFGSPGFDDGDPFSRGFLGVVKRKKDIKHTDFHDPVRESFEAELERVQKMQELERQRIVEEQERAMEQARREEEERQRLIREEEERRQRLEEEVKQAAWRAEQERLEAIRRVEEQRIAREEERRRILVEEERRKQAAKQKLLELEAKIAKREAEVAKVDGPVGDEKLPAATKGKDISSAMGLDNWEESERMVERITTSASFDASGSNRGYGMRSRPHFAREGSSSVPIIGKPVNSWRRDMFENGGGSSSAVQDLEIGHYSPRRDALGSGRVIPRKDLYGGGGYMPSGTYFKEGVQEPYMDEFSHQRDHQWNLSGDADSYHGNREFDSEFHDNLVQKYGDVGWGQARYHGYPRPHTEEDDLYSYGRSRYAMRQPRVLPPPLASLQKTSFKGANKHPGPSSFLDNDSHCTHASSESTRQAGCNGSHDEGLEPSSIIDVRRENSEIEKQKSHKEVSPYCDSQSSLSVSSPPNSPPHLSHDESDELGDSPLMPPAVDGKNLTLSGNQSIVTSNAGKEDTLISLSSSISVVEDEEWAIESSDRLQQQEEYDEDEDGYQVEDEVHEGDDENLDLNQEFEDLQLEEKDSSHMVDNVVLGFDDGVEVKIPSDDFERNPGSDDIGFGMSGASEHILENQGSDINVQCDDQNLQTLYGSSQMSRDNSSTKFHESERVIQESVIELTTTPYTSVASDILVGVVASSNSGTSSEQTVSSLSDTPSFVGQTTASGSSQADPPVKLQFGLFSGPSLIPSPVPAIQIGTIQMPLHLHPPFGPSLNHIHPSQPPFFQFGQLGYTSPISQGILPMEPQTMSFVQPNVQVNYNPTQNDGGSLPVRPAQDTPKKNIVKEDLPSVPVSKHPGFSSGAVDQSHKGVLQKSDSVSVRESGECSFLTKVPGIVGGRTSSEFFSRAEHKGQHGAEKNYFSPSKGRASEGQSQAMQAQSRPVPSEKNFGGLRSQGPQSNGRGRRFAYAVKSSGLRSNIPAPDSSGFQRRPRRIVQRTEFRVRENGGKRELPGPGSVPSSNLGWDENSNFSGRAATITARSGSKRGTVSIKASKEIVESENVASVNVSSQEVVAGNRPGKEILRNAVNKSQNPSPSLEGNLKRNISEEDVDAPLQSGVVRVFKQPGIEAPSDEDDFIQVRSKRQMLNDRREQREKEINAKSHVIKLLPRKPRASRQSHVGSTSLNKRFAPVAAPRQNVNTDYGATKGRGLANKKVSGELENVLSQALAPIGTPAGNSETQADTKSQANNSAANVSSSGKDTDAGVMSEGKNKIVDVVPTSLTSWGTMQINEQVMALTWTQLEAKKQVQFDSHIASVGGQSSTDTEPTLPSSSILMKDKLSFSSSTSPINSLLAGEKIQFGAVTSPTVLPPSSRAVSNGIGVPGSVRTAMRISQSLSVAETVLSFEKDKNSSDSSVLPNCEAEAEAAASAVAVAAISSDDTIGNDVCSVSVSGTKSAGSADIDGVTTGIASDEKLPCQLTAEDSLSVSLPADLSVETPPISLWPPLPSPQNSSSQVLSHFPGGPPSHFPFYEMNPLLSGPIFAFGPHEESASSQSQSQKNTPSSLEPPTSWQHSMVDSFYGPPAGFSGPFIGPPGGIPGVQGPPHMVVYNHFTPVGQFGQVGLSYMGTTYIPSGKQRDWKHNPTASTMSIDEGEMNKLNIASSQRSTFNMPAPIQHLAPGSPLLRMASPVGMFDVSPFQSAPEMSAQSRWSHIPASPIHSIPSSRPLQQEAGGVFPFQFGRGHLVDQSLNANKFPDTQTSTSSSNGPSFSVVADTNVPQFPDELGVGNSSGSSSAVASTHSAACQSSSGNATVNAGKNDSIRDGLSKESKGMNNGSLRSQSSSEHRIASGQKSQSSGYSCQRGGVSHRNSSGNEWSYRRTGYHSRNQSFNSDKGFPSAKVKQIYVAKQTSSGT